MCYHYYHYHCCCCCCYYTCYVVLELNGCCALKAKHVYSLNIALRYNTGNEVLLYPVVHLGLASISLQPVPPFVVDAEIGLSLASRWKLWLSDFETFLLPRGITDKKCQRALLLYQDGPQVRETFAQLSDVGGVGKGKLNPAL